MSTGADIQLRPLSVLGACPAQRQCSIRDSVWVVELLGWFWGPKCVPGRVGLGTRDLSVDMPVPTTMTDPGLREAEKISYSNFSHRGVRRWPECKSQKIVKDAFRCAHGRVERQRKKKGKRKKNTNTNITHVVKKKKPK